MIFYLELFYKKCVIIKGDFMLNGILNEYKKFSQVKAIAVAGSSLAKTADKSSDIDVYVFTKEDIPLKKREELIKPISSKHEIGGEYFGSGDEFYVDTMDKQLDVMYWNTDWFENTVKNIWEKFYPSNGYSTCFLHTLNICQIFHDSNGWLQDLKDKLKKDYPQELQQNIIKRNMMLLKDKPFASYYEQIEKAIKRDDKNSINHRISAFMASYFDIILAKNKMLHPGEKKLVNYCLNNCKILPDKFEANINNVLTQPNPKTLNILGEMIENLRKIL